MIAVTVVISVKVQVKELVSHDEVLVSGLKLPAVAVYDELLTSLLYHLGEQEKTLFKHLISRQLTTICIQ